jgi:hypothetical protein
MEHLSFPTKERVQGFKGYGLRGKEQVEAEIKVKIERRMDSRLRGNDGRET